MELILVRHGETRGTREGIYYGRLDLPLTENGKKQVLRAASKLKNEEIAAIYTSPLARARQTARVIARVCYLKGEVHLEPELAEMDFGRWEGLTAARIAERFPHAWKRWCDRWWDAEVPGGESAACLYERVTGCIDRILSEHKRGRIVIVTHHGCLRAIISHLLGAGREGYWHFKFLPGSITRIDITEDKFAILTLFNG